MLWFVANMAMPRAHDGTQHVVGPADISRGRPTIMCIACATRQYRLPVIKPPARSFSSGWYGTDCSLLTGHFTILAFIYTRCGDICRLQQCVLRSCGTAEVRSRARSYASSPQASTDHDTRKGWPSSQSHGLIQCHSRTRGCFSRSQSGCRRAAACRLQPTACTQGRQERCVDQ